MWEEMKIAPPRGSKDDDVKGSRLYKKRRASLSSTRTFIFFCEISVDYILASYFIGWICIRFLQNPFYLLQEFHHCVSDMHITRFAAVLVLFFTGMCVNTIK